MSREITAEIQRHVSPPQADAKLAELSRLMKDNHDAVRAMDVDEARTYLEGAVSEE